MLETPGLPTVLIEQLQFLNQLVQLLVDLGAPVLLLATEELKPEPAPERIVQLTRNPKLVTRNLVVSLIAPVLPLLA
jgi:hypothetical protein